MALALGKCDSDEIAMGVWKTGELCFTICEKCDETIMCDNLEGRKLTS